MSLTSCATLVNGRTQAIPISSSPDGAEVTVGALHGVTPVTMILTRAQGHVVEISKSGYAPASVTLERSISGWVVGNAAFGLLGVAIGSGIDAGTGASHTLMPKQVHVTLQPQVTPLPPAATCC